MNWSFSPVISTQVLEFFHLFLSLLTLLFPLGKMKVGMILLETVYPSYLVDFPTFVVNIAIPRFVYGIQTVEKEEIAGDEKEYWNRKQSIKRLQIVPRSRSRSYSFGNSKHRGYGGAEIKACWWGMITSFRFNYGGFTVNVITHPCQPSTSVLLTTRFPWEKRMPNFSCWFDTIGIITLFNIMDLIVLKIVENKSNNPKIARASLAIIRENFTYLVKLLCCSKILYQLCSPCIVARDKGKS